MGASKWNSETVSQWFRDKNSELLSEYKNLKDKIRFKCSRCGENAEYHSFDALKGYNSKCLCKNCNKENRGKHNALDPERVKKWFIDRGSELLSEYVSSSRRIIFKCSKCGSIAEHSNLTNFRIRRSDCLCKKCAREKQDQGNRLSQKEVEKWFIDRGGELLSEYKNNSTKIIFKCSRCGSIGENYSFNNMKGKDSQCLCTKCARDNTVASRKVTKDRVEIWMREHNSKLLKFTGNRDEIHYICSKCGMNAIYSNFIHLRERNSDCLCRECIKKGFTEKRRLPESDVRQWFLDRNSELLSPYEGIDSEIIYKCSNCGVSAKGHSFYNFRSRNSKCLCRVCRKIFVSGENNNFWSLTLDDNKRQSFRKYNNPWYLPWKKAVLREHNYTCTITGENKGDIVIHHLYNWADFPEQRVFLSNGVVIRRDLHKEFHEIYGRRNNTPEQFMEFVERYYVN